MDVSIAVSLIRGQMGAVVERAVNGAVETVLAEMLRVVGVKFEELKAQVVVMKRDMAVLQREKALKEKENDSIRAKLRYTELKLKYYRQGVEEELQQRASASTMVRIHPSSFSPAQRGGAVVPSTEASPPCSALTRTASGALARSDRGCNVSRASLTVGFNADVGLASADLSDVSLPVSLSENAPPENLDTCTERDATQSREDEDDCEWTVTLQRHTEAVDTDLTPPSVQSPPPEQSHQSGSVPLSPGSSTQADSSRVPSAVPQVKQEAPQQQQQQEVEEEVICIKEEPKEEQEVVAILLLDCQLQQSDLPQSEGQRSTTEWTEHQVRQRNLPDPTGALSAAGPSSYPLPQLTAPLPSVVAVPPGGPPRLTPRPWTKELSLYEEYKLRRNELRRRSLSKRRELEKTLPQPLLADLKVRERREKTRLRVARWRAKRKLQACLNQAQGQGDAAGLSQLHIPLSSQAEQLRSSCDGSIHHKAREHRGRKKLYFNTNTKA
ncbi:hypothetical protein LDENG_00251600 [Lucifuga dentata]|nr:hypothetical protein LDENG_00251600 [Lucifuga dentata]